LGCPVKVESKYSTLNFCPYSTVKSVPYLQSPAFNGYLSYAVSLYLALCSTFPQEIKVYLGYLVEHRMNE
jgi:hypothetical protein